MTAVAAELDLPPKAVNAKAVQDFEKENSDNLQDILQSLGDENDQNEQEEQEEETVEEEEEEEEEEGDDQLSQSVKQLRKQAKKLSKEFESRKKTVLWKYSNTVQDTLNEQKAIFEEQLTSLLDSVDTQTGDVEADVQDAEWLSEGLSKLVNTVKQLDVDVKNTLEKSSQTVESVREIIKSGKRAQASGKQEQGWKHLQQKHSKVDLTPEGDTVTHASGKITQAKISQKLTRKKPYGVLGNRRMKK
eukprot:TRINITY_DN370_c4_g1_i1.p1 TRINITY_DN370_c4_g1~~TRINITY_DN370_c4_g1_i1.p1  ORF type:complete len:246 (+),score=102.79 TRINITY_DN370_c4_g1_i1:244-981(+)